jgi:nucleoside-diphosphate kinase
MGDITFSMIKPDAVKDGYTGLILSDIEAAGFKIISLKKTQLTTERAAAFYAVHKDKPFFQSLLNVMTSGPIVAMILKKENAVAEFRKLIGATNPSLAEEGTIRKKYARSLESNAIHGSDSDENALIESAFFFSKLEWFE